MKLCVMAFVILMIIGCQKKSQDATKSEDKAIVETPLLTDNALSDVDLAKKYCGRCHQYPEPSLLPTDIWENYMLPRMGYMHGIYPDKKSRNELLGDEGGKIVEKANIFPENQIIEAATWNRIKDFYLKNSKPVFENKTDNALTKNTSLFKAKTLELPLKIPSVTMVKFSEGNGIMVGDANTEMLYLLDEKGLKVKNAAKVKEGAVSVIEEKDYLWITVMGSFSPTDAAKGLIVKLPLKKGLKVEVPIKNLQRPVHSVLEDFNGDGYKDLLVCEFGKWTGALSLFWQDKNGAFRKQVIWPQSGAIKAYVRDINKDGFLDIIALFGQGNEAIRGFINQGDGSFEERLLLEFSASNGSSYFHLQDIDGDGDEDIVYTSGDNADYQPILKPWHGIYFYENDGNYKFSKSFFYPLNGAYNAKVADFDQDGDLDIAALSFFPDWSNRPEESFLFLENRGAGDYLPQTFETVNIGRWMVMDANDYDKDGDLDIILGALTFETVPDVGLVQQWVKEGIGAVILENTLK